MKPKTKKKIKDFVCRNCGRQQLFADKNENGGITAEEAISIGWIIKNDEWYCPFCSGNEEKLLKVFNQ